MNELNLTWLAVILYTTIEWLRIKASWGKVPNINHWISFFIAFTFFALLVLWFEVWKSWTLCFYIIYFVAARGVGYEPLLNLMLGRSLSNEGSTSNNKTDRAERWLKLDFVEQRVLYSVAAAASYILYKTYA